MSAPVGAVLVLGYETGSLRWSNTFDTAVLKAISAGRLQAITAGQTALSSEGRPVCNPGQMCPHFIQGFKATVVVGH